MSSTVSKPPRKHRAINVTYSRVHMPACLPANKPSYLPDCLPSKHMPMPACVHAGLSPCLLIYLGA